MIYPKKNQFGLVRTAKMLIPRQERNVVTKDGGGGCRRLKKHPKPRAELSIKRQSTLGVRHLHDEKDRRKEKTAKRV